MNRIHRKRTVIFGSGQVGQMLARLLSINYQILCFADNASEKWTQNLHLQEPFGDPAATKNPLPAAVPVCSPASSLQLDPEVVVLGVLDYERQTQMREQMLSLGYQGGFLDASCLHTFDNRAAVMRMLSEQIHRAQVPGDTAELGVFRGDFSVLIHEAFPDRTLHLFDTFEGFQQQDVAVEHSASLSHARTGEFSDTSEALVLSRMDHPGQICIHKGWFPSTFQEVENTAFCFVSLDADLYAPTAAALPLFYEQLAPGGVLLIHDVYSTQFSGCRKAVEEFCNKIGVFPYPVCDLHGSAVIRRQR